jgi:UDP-GlcNAc:undecaprenyl-phosphate GlcNAc-1-phosphate transferase
MFVAVLREISQLEFMAFVGGALLAALLLPGSLPLFRRFGLVDKPNARSVHVKAIPRGAGLVLVISFISVVYGYWSLHPAAGIGGQPIVEAILWAVVIIAVTGFLDDIWGLPTWIKLFFQVGTALVLVSAGLVIPLPELFGQGQATAEAVLTCLWIVGVINAVNFIDGSDGLATTLSMLSMLVFVVISHIVVAHVLQSGRETLPPFARTIDLIGFAGAGCAVPFLLYNLSPAKCFLGDVGSTFFGLLLAVLGILMTRYSSVWEGVPGGYLIVPWLVLFVPIADSIRVAGERVLRGRNPLLPDNRHLHHLLHKAGLTANQILLLVALLIVALGFAAAALPDSGMRVLFVLGAVLHFTYAGIWFLRSSYKVRRYLTLALIKRLLSYADSTEGYETAVSFRDRFEQEVARARRHGHPLSLVVVNTSALKGRKSHATPLENPRFLDHILRNLRREDIKCRLSGDRLAFVLVETDSEIAGHVCERIQSQFEAIKNGESSALQTGIGAASFPEDGKSLTVLLRIAEARALNEIHADREGDLAVAGRAAEESPELDAENPADAEESPRSSEAADGEVPAASRNVAAVGPKPGREGEDGEPLVRGAPGSSEGWLPN